MVGAPMNSGLESVSGCRMLSCCTATTPSMARTSATRLAGRTAETPPYTMRKLSRDLGRRDLAGDLGDDGVLLGGDVALVLLLGGRGSRQLDTGDRRAGGCQIGDPALVARQRVVVELDHHRLRRGVGPAEQCGIGLGEAAGRRLGAGHPFGGCERRGAEIRWFVLLSSCAGAGDERRHRQDCDQSDGPYPCPRSMTPSGESSHSPKPPTWSSPPGAELISTSCGSQVTRRAHRTPATLEGLFRRRGPFPACVGQGRLGPVSGRRA